MQSLATRRAVWLALALGALACTPPAQSAGRGPPGSKDGPPKRPPTPVAVAPIVSGSIASHYATTATLDAEKTAPVLARVQGVVRTIAVEEGDVVTAGGTLLRIDNDEYRFRHAQVSAQVAGLRNRFERAQSMVKKGLVTVEEFESLQHELAAAEAEEGLSQLAVDRTTVRAPFGGKVTRRSINVGETVRDGTELFQIADMMPLLARVHVPSKTFKKLRADQAVELILDSNGETLSGKIKLVSPVIDPNTGTIKVTIEIDAYPEGTRPGDFTRVQIVTERRDDVVLVPRSAIVDDRGERAIFIVDGDAAVRRIVTVGFEQDENAQILEGAKLGEQVIVKGQHTLKDGGKIKIVDQAS